MIHIAIVEDEDSYIQQLTEYMDRFRQEYSQEIRLSFFRDGDEIDRKSVV